MFAPEIYDRICSASLEERGGKKTAIAFAQASRELHAIAIKHPWRSIPNIYPLTVFLPADVWNPTTEKILRKIKVSDLARFRLHANHVHSYGPYVHWERNKNAHVQVYKALNAVSIQSKQPLLPNVQAILLNYDEYFAKASLLAALCGDKIRRCHVHLPRVQPNDPIKVTASTLANSKEVISSTLSKQTGLQYLIITPELHLTLIETLSEALRSFTGTLRGLEMSVVHPGTDAIKQIALLPHLSKLELDLRDVEGNPFQDIRQENQLSGPTCFPSLRSISIQCNGAPICLSLLSLLPTGAQIIEADFRCMKATKDGWKQIIACLSVHSDPALLKALSMEDSFMGPDWDKKQSDDDWDYEHLEPLLPFSNLERIAVDIYGAFQFDDDLMERMATSWTKIRDVRFFSENREADRKITLKGIQAFAKNSPDLDTLTISFDARRPAGRGPAKLKSPSACKLEELNVLYSPIANSARVISFLRDSFPHLKRFSQWDNCGFSRGFKEWHEVQEALELEESES